MRTPCGLCTAIKGKRLLYASLLAFGEFCATSPAWLYTIRFLDSGGRALFLRHLLHTSDLVASVESFEGMGLTEESHGLGDFTGLCRIHRLPRLNTLARYFPDTALYAFKLRRQSLRLEKLHPLPEGESGGAASQRGERVLPPSAPHQSTHASLAADGLNSKSPQDSRVSDARVGEGQKPNTGMGDTARGVPTQGSKPAVHGVNLKDLEF
eukprot:Rmarinus@m.3754